MSMYIGYGILMEDIIWNENAEMALLETALDKCPEIRGVYEDNIRDMDGETDEEKKLSFVNGYEGSNGWQSGFDALLVDTIHEGENLSQEICLEDWCLHVACDIPRNEGEKEKMLTQEDIESIFRKYLNPLTDTILEFGFYTIRT